MRTVRVNAFCGSRADSLIHARRLGQKLQHMQEKGQCVLVIWHGLAEIRAGFVALVSVHLRPDKIRMGGLPDIWRDALPPGFDLPPMPPRI